MLLKLWQAYRNSGWFWFTMSAFLFYGIVLGVAFLIPSFNTFLWR